MLICKQWEALGFNWRLLRHRRSAWYYLEKDGQIIAENGDRSVLLSMGWWN